MTNKLLKLLTAGALLGAVSAQASLLVTFGDFANPSTSSTPVISATEGEDTGIITATSGIDISGMTRETTTTSRLELTAITSSYSSQLSFTVTASSAISVDSTSFYFDFINGTRGSRFTQVTVNTLDPSDTDGSDGFTILDTVTLAEVNTGNTPEPNTVTSAAGAFSALDSGTFFQVIYAIRSSETWADQDMDNLSVGFVVPEPSTYALALGLLALGGVLLRRRLR